MNKKQFLKDYRQARQKFYSQKVKEIETFVFDWAVKYFKSQEIKK